MPSSFCYMANLAARGGAFTAVQNLSPDAHSRSAFLFDLPRPTLEEGKTIDLELDKRAEGIAQCGKLGGRIYFDVHDFPPRVGHRLRATTDQVFGAKTSAERHGFCTGHRYDYGSRSGVGRGSTRHCNYRPERGMSPIGA
jgi:hypothetical protein